MTEALPWWPKIKSKPKPLKAAPPSGALPPSSAVREQPA
jgi:hypothetical protein